MEKRDVDITITREKTYEERFILDSIMATKHGQEVYIYKKDLLNKLTKELDKKKVEYEIKETDGYWLVRGLNGNGKKKKKQNY